MSLEKQILQSKANNINYLKVPALNIPKPRRASENFTLSRKIVGNYEIQREIGKG
jgi:hypothetical protein